MRLRLKSKSRRNLVINSNRKAVLIRPLAAALLILGSALIPLYSQMSSALSADSIELNPLSKNRPVGVDERKVVIKGDVSYQLDTASG